MAAITRRSALVVSIAALACLDTIFAPWPILMTHCTLCGMKLPDRLRLRAACPDLGKYPEDNWCGRCLGKLIEADTEAKVRAHLASL